MMPSIVYPIEVDFPPLTTFSVLSMLLAAIATSALFFLLIKNNWLLGRPAFAFAGLVNLLYQWPIAMASEQIESSLASPLFFVLTPHLVVFGAIAWVSGTDRLSLSGATVAPRKLPTVEVTLSIAAALLFTLLYFARVPARCTALFALIYDPASTLLAREVSIKFAGSTLATSSYGALVNTVLPAIAAIGIVQIIFVGIKKRRPIAIAAWTLGIFVCITLIMLAGAKGLLLPLVGVVLLSAVFWSTSFWGKVFSGAASVLCIVSALAAFELAKDRNGSVQAYDFAGCVNKLGANDQARELIASMLERGGLNLRPEQIAELSKQFHTSANSQTFATKRKSDVGTFTAGDYLKAIFNRAFIAPIQVAAWHHLYVDEIGSPGIGAFPLAKKIVGFSVDPTVLVYQRYGTVYSGGDKTSTSTAPTSFIFSWPAYFGFWGVALALACVLALDVATALILRRSPTNLLPVGVGLVAVISFNMITSDFVVVMLSHGGAVALLLMGAYAAIEMQRRNGATSQVTGP
ncbi:hypothetical protein [Pseudaminobacter sp. NGMCC 1.201702]|uniref:hypothetical protein n=1 Tax=Pseudaminobacter sp. NGMCC 1.201702 TaxID=3391825 RepID=UPI0039EE79DE